MYGLLLCMRRIVVCSHSDRLWWSWQQQQQPQQFAIIFEELKWLRIPCCTNNVYMWFFFISTSYFFNGIRVCTRKWKSSKHMQTHLIWIKMIKMSKHDSMHMCQMKNKRIYGNKICEKELESDGGRRKQLKCLKHFTWRHILNI